MKKSIQNLESKSIKNVNLVKGGEDGTPQITMSQITLSGGPGSRASL